MKDGFVHTIVKCQRTDLIVSAPKHPQGFPQRREYKNFTIPPNACNTHFTYDELDFIDLAGRERVISSRTLAQGAVKSVISGVANACVKLGTIPHLRGTDHERVSIDWGTIVGRTAWVGCTHRGAWHPFVGGYLSPLRSKHKPTINTRRSC